VDIPDADVEQFRSQGFVVLRAQFDPDPLIDEIEVAFDRAFVRADHLNVSAEAAIAFRYLPTMTQRTPVSLALLHRFERVAEQLLATEVLPVRAKAIEYHGDSTWHRDSELELSSVGFACYLEPLTASAGALRVLPASHRSSQQLDVTAVDAAPCLETSPGDVIVLDEHLLHASTGGGVRRQWRCDYVARPNSARDAAPVRAYYAAIFSSERDVGYDVDVFPTYGPYWRATCRADVDRSLDELGAYRAADAEEAGARARANVTSAASPGSRVKTRPDEGM
jgi:hypothetical protein